MKKELANFDYCNEAIDLKNKLEGSFLELGARLYQIKENSLYEPNWASWVEFTWELKMSDNTINKLIQIYKTLILGYGFNNQQILNAGGWTVVADVLPMITSKKDALRWLNLASTLTRTDLRKEIKEAKTGIDMGDCKHINTRRIMIEICNICGQKHEIFEGETGWNSQHNPYATGSTSTFFDLSKKTIVLNPNDKLETMAAMESMEKAIKELHKMNEDAPTVLWGLPEDYEAFAEYGDKSTPAINEKEEALQSAIEEHYKIGNININETI